MTDKKFPDLVVNFFNSFISTGFPVLVGTLYVVCLKSETSLHIFPNSTTFSASCKPLKVYYIADSLFGYKNENTETDGYVSHEVCEPKCICSFSYFPRDRDTTSLFPYMKKSQAVNRSFFFVIFFLFE